MSELLIALASLWFIGGIYLDGWAHNHIDIIDTFFTPWHAAFYSGFLALAASLVIFKRHDQTYRHALFGILVFFAGGIGDMLWHITFGIEKGVDALLSPTHLLLAVGGTLMASGPFLSWYRNPARSATLAGQLPLLASSLSLLAMFTFMVQYSSFVDLAPVGIQPDTYGGVIDNQAVAISGYLIHGALMMGVLFLVMSRGKPAPGFVTLLFGINVIAMAVMREGAEIIPAAIIAAIAADIVLQLLYRRGPTIGLLRLYAFWVPFSFFLLYMATLLLRGDVWWSIHAWTGATVMAGFSGLLLSFLVWPPASDPSA